MAKDRPQSQRAYAKEGSGHCPVCGSTQVVYDNMDYDEYYVSQPLSCEACYASWIEEYKLVGYSCLQDNKGDV